MFVKFLRAVMAPETGEGTASQPATPAQPPATTPPPEPEAGEGGSLLGGEKPAAAAPESQPQGEEQKADEAADGKAEAEGQEGEKPTPESYGDFTFPEGFQVDEAAVGEFKSLAADLGLTKEQAQKLVDFRAAQHQQYMAALDRQAEEWVQAAKSDKEFGGPDFSKNIAIADRAISKYGTPELRALLNQYGLGNHPELVRFAYRAGLEVTEPGPVNTTGPAPEAMSTADFYAKEVFSQS